MRTSLIIELRPGSAVTTDHLKTLRLFSWYSVEPRRKLKHMISSNLVPSCQLYWKLEKKYGDSVGGCFDPEVTIKVVISIQVCELF